MTLEIEMKRAFHVALLLTGSLKCAERAVVPGIEQFDEDATAEPLLRATIRAALRQRGSAREPRARQCKRSSASLPRELQAVLLLAPVLRDCFVLRVLLRLPDHACAELLHLDAGYVAERTCAAIEALADMDEQAGRAFVTEQVWTAWSGA